MGGVHLEALEDFQGPVVTPVDDALRYSQEGKYFAEIRSSIDAVSWRAATASQREQQDLSKSREVHPYSMWIKVSGK